MLFLDCTKHGVVDEQATCNQCTAEIVRELKQAQTRVKALELVIEEAGLEVPDAH